MENPAGTLGQPLLRCLPIVTLALVPLLAVANLSAQERPVEVQVTSGEVASAAAVASKIRYHLFPANTAAGKVVPLDSPGVTFPPRKHPLAAPLPTIPSFPAGTGFYPDQLFKVSSTGATIKTTKSHPIYLNMSACGGTVAACWGNPALFLGDLGASSMIHLLDTQYVPSTASGRYTVGTQFTATATIYPGTSGVPTLGENDILGIVHSAASNAAGGTGYGHIYHLFIPPGVDTCMDAGPCYSPDNLGAFAFCAYHYTVTFADIGAVYYTVEPYQDVAGCQVPTGTPNGQLVDSTNSVLSHELFESITDPDISTGFRSLNSPFGAAEIGDECAFIVIPVTLNTRKYAIQGEFSNKYEACATTP
jgi:hypothetical protein